MKQTHPNLLELCFKENSMVKSW